MKEGENMSKKVEIKITSEIHQEDESAVFERDGLGSIEKVGEDWRIKYSEKNLSKYFIPNTNFRHFADKVLIGLKVVSYSDHIQEVTLKK